MALNEEPYCIPKESILNKKYRPFVGPYSGEDYLGRVEVLNTSYSKP